MNDTKKIPMMPKIWTEFSVIAAFSIVSNYQLPDLVACRLAMSKLSLTANCHR